MQLRLNQSSQGPLRGIRVLDLSNVVSGPLCGQILGDLGADVIKVEAITGDLSRRLGPPFVDGLTPLYLQCNRNKRALVVDLKQPAGQQLVQHLAREVDVVLENFRPDVSERLGIGYEQLSLENPGLVYLSINGFGPDGPYRDLPAYDSVIQGLGGFMHTQGSPESGPGLVKSLVADKATALTAAYSVLAALLARERADDGQDTKTGQKIDIPMLDAYAAFMLPDIIGADSFPDTEPPDMPKVDVHRVYPTRDGHVVMMIVEDHQFHGICRALEREDLIDDPRTESLLARIMNFAEVTDILASECVRWTTSDLVRKAREHDVPLAPANDLEGFFADEQVRHNKSYIDSEDKGAGTLRMLRSPPRFSATPTSLNRHPPRLGEQTDEILAEAGYSPEAIAEFKRKGVIG